MTGTDMPRRLPKGCIEDRDRHGNVRIYYRVTGRPKVRLQGVPWTPDFMAQYDAAKGVATPKVKGVTSGTWRWLCVKYFAECAEYKRLDARTQHVRRQILELTFDEKIRPDSDRLFRDMPLTKMDTGAVEVLRDRKIEAPEAANSRVKAIRQVFKWGVKKKSPDGKPYAQHNPARDVEYFRTASAGFRTWSIDEVHQFQKRHQIGTPARLAMDLLLYTGQRRSDIIRFGRQHVCDGKLTFTQHKGRNRKPKRLTLPVLPVLQATIDASPCGDMTFLLNGLGRPFTDAGFGNWFRDRCIEADVPGRAHGLRKAGATIAADNGATAHQLMAIFGWDTLKQAEIYTRAANQKRLAAEAMHLLAGQEQTRTEMCPTEPASGTFLRKT